MAEVIDIPSPRGFSGKSGTIDDEIKDLSGKGGQSIRDGGLN